MGFFSTIRNLTKRWTHRLLAKPIPKQEEMEEFGAEGEDYIYRLLRRRFDTVIRGAAIPSGKKYLEKDFLILYKGVPVVIEVKNWKGVIGYHKPSNRFYQDKPNGTQKIMKSPVDSTNRFIDQFKRFYGLDCPVLGFVIFADPDCALSLPKEMDGIRLVKLFDAVNEIVAAVKTASGAKCPLPEGRFLRCARIRSGSREFCKGLLADERIPCFTTDGRGVRLNPDFISKIRISHQPLRLRDKMTVTYTNGAKDVFFNHDTVLTLCCLDGTTRRIALSKIRTVIL